jgi:homogentisate 1,2-dioxygenase
LAAFTENASTGELTAATSSPYRTHFYKACAQVPGTAFIALAQNDNTLNLYRMTPAPDPLSFDPAIRTLMPTSRASTQGFPVSLAASRSFAYVSDAQNFAIRGFAIDSAAG